MAGLFYWCYMAIDERGVNLRITADASEVRKGTEDAKQAVRDMAQSVTQSGAQAGKGLDAIGKGADGAAKGVDRSTKSMISSIQRQTAVLEAGSRTNAKYWETLASQRGVDPNVLKPYLDQLDSVRAKQSIASSALAGGAIQFDKYGMSAKQTAAAMRGVPAQLTDIFVSIQGGQRPMTVLLQQGGQLKDMFGGIVPAARALATGVMAMVNPFTLAAAAIGGVFAMYRMGASEGEAFRKSIVMTGGAAGVTAAELQGMAANIGGIVGTQRSASAALNEFANATKIGSGNLEAFATAALKWEEATGTAVSDTVKHFEELGKDPLKASLKLNESMNYLTASVYDQITALVEQGKETEAAAVAQKAFADTINDRAPGVVENIGTIESAWRGVKNVMASVISAMADIGRDTGSAGQLAQLQADLKRAESDNMYTRNPVRAKRLREEIALMQERIEKEKSLGETQKQIDEERKKALKAAQDLDTYLGDNSRLSRTAQMEKDVAKEEALYAARVADAKDNTDTLQKLETAHQIALKNIKDKYKEKASSGGGGGKSQAQKELERQQKAELKAIEDFEKERAKSTAGLYAEISAIQEKTRKVEDEIAVYGMGKAAIDAMVIGRKESELAALQEIGVTGELIDQLKLEIKARKELMSSTARKEALDANTKAAEQAATEWQKTNESIGQSLTDALLRGFESGKSFAENFKDTLKNMFRTLVLQPIIQPMMNQVAGGIQSVLGMGGQQGGIMGILGQANSGFDSIFSGSSGLLSSGISSMGQAMGSEALTSFAAGMKGAALAPGLAGPTTAGASGAMGAGNFVGSNMGSILGYGSAIYSLTQGQYGSAAGAAIGTAILPGIGTAVGSMLGGLADSLFGGPPKTRHGQRTQVDWSGDAFEISKRDNRVDAGAADAVLELTRASVTAANEIFKRVGVDAAIESFSALMESSVLGDRQGVLSGGTLRIGDQTSSIGVLDSPSSQSGFGGWSDKDMFSRLATDIQLSILEAFQQAGVLSSILEGVNIRGLGEEAAAQLAATVQAVVQEVSAFQTAVEQLPFASFRDLSFDAAASLLKVSGGIENLLGVIQGYNESAFTDAEKVEMAQGRLSDAFAQLGVEVPTSVQALRSLVDAQGLATEEDQRRTLALMSLAPALVEVTAAAEAMAERMRGLTSTYFSLFKSGQEQYDLAASQLAGQFEKLGYTLPKSASEYTALVDSIDMSTGASRALKEQLLALAQPMRGLIDKAVELASAAGEAVQNGLSINDLYAQQTVIVDQLREKVSGLAAEVQTAFANRAMAQSLSAQISQALGEGVSTAAKQADLWSQVRSDITPGQRLDAAQELMNLLTYVPPADLSVEQATLAAAQEFRTAAQEQRSAAQAAMSAAQQQISSAKALQDAGRRLREYVQGLRTSDLSPLTMAEKVAEAAGHYQRTLSAAQGGDEEAQRNLQGVSSTYLDLARQFYASNQAYTDIFNSVTGALDGFGSGLLGQGDSLSAVAQAQLDAAQAALAAAEQQLVSADQQIQTAQSQLETARVGNGLSADQISQLKSLQDIINEIEADADTSFKTLATQLGQELALLDSMEKALGIQSTVPGLLAGLPAGIAAALAPILDANAGKYVQGLYQDILGRQADQPGAQYWQDQFNAGSKGLTDYIWSANEESIRNAYQQVMGRDVDQPGLEFYSRQMQSGKSIEDIIKELEWGKAHGSHANGLANVPFDNYKAILHKDERVLTARENREYNRMDWSQYGRGEGAMNAVVSELKAVRAELAEIKSQQGQAAEANIRAQYEVGSQVAGAVKEGSALGTEVAKTRNVRLT